MARRKPHKQPPPEFIKELSTKLGGVVIAASQIEHSVGMALADMFRLTRLQYYAFIMPMSISTKVTLLRQLGKEYLSLSNRKILKKLLTEIEKCSELRNELVHGFYGAKSGRFALIAFSGEGRFSGQPVYWTPPDLARSARMIGARDSGYRVRHLFPSRLKLPKNPLPIDASGRM
jgi:hypothetical protein